jgi:hypothetical protein
MTQPVEQAALDRRSESEKEYGQYVAVGAIDILGARAFNTGDPVPVSHVERGVVTPEQVAKVTTKAGRAAAGIDETKG